MAEAKNQAGYGHRLVASPSSDVLLGFLRTRRWFGAKAREIDSVVSVGSVPLERRAGTAEIIFVEVRYRIGASDHYVLPLGRAYGESAAAVRRDRPSAIVGPGVDARYPDGEVILYEVLEDRDFLDALLEVIANGRQLPGTRASIVGERTRAFDSLRGPVGTVLQPSLSKAEQSNSSIRYGDRLILKLFRRLQEGINPEVEIGSFLTNHTSFRSFAPVAGTLAYRLENDAAGSLAVLQAFVPNQGDAWKYTLGELRGYFERVKSAGVPRVDTPPGSPLGVAPESIPDAVQGLIGEYLHSARLLGRRTAELHSALASDSSDPDFRPEPLDRSYMQGFCESVSRQARERLQLLGSTLGRLDPGTVKLAERVLAAESGLLGRLKSMEGSKCIPVATRTHGDYHLGQVLYTGADFVIIDFEGEPARPLPERRRKRSPLQDVAGMLRSFHYAAYKGLFEAQNGATAEVSGEALEPWARCWSFYVSSAFLASYFAVAGMPFLSEPGSSPEPPDPRELAALLDVHLLEKAIYELDYELNNRPDWVRIPLRGILDLLEFSA